MAPSASISGVLIDYVIKDSPPWAAHRTVTQADALRALAIHMRRDAISTGYPINSVGDIFGNFFIASAGFHIDEPSPDILRQFTDMWNDHVKSEHVRVWKKLNKLYIEAKEAVQEYEDTAYGSGVDRREQERRKLEIIRQHRPNQQALERILESIYMANAPKE